MERSAPWAEIDNNMRSVHGHAYYVLKKQTGLILNVARLMLIQKDEK